MSASQSSAKHFFDNHVIPNYREWLAQPTDIRLAMNAVLSLYHMTDHFWYTFYKTDTDRVFKENKFGDFRYKLTQLNKEYALIRDIADAHKHMILENPTKPKRIVTQSKQTTIGTTEYNEAEFGTGPYGGGLSIVVVLDDGSKKHLSYSLKKVKELWESMLP